MEAFPLRAVAHGERLTLTEHLGELRVRLLLSVAVLAVLFAGCLWQSRSLLHVLNVPLAQLRISSAAEGGRGELPQALARSAGAFTRLAHASSLAATDQRAALSAARSLAAASQSLAHPEPARPLRSDSGSRSPPRSLWPSRSRCSSDCRSSHPGVGVRLTGDRSRRAARGAAAPAVAPALFATGVGSPTSWSFRRP